jgi:pyruvate dehydrogenase E1 component alpha subunit
MAPGVALSLTVLGQEGIVACFFGDGAACEGIFHESVNLAAVWNLPILYVCENNQWQAYVRRKETMLVDHIADRAAGYGIEGRTVDGNDVDAVYAAATEAAAAIRRTKRPFLLETYTYRQRGHFEPDDQAYVDPAELASWKARDPIATYRRRLITEGVLTESEADAAGRAAAAKVETAAQFAAGSPFPAPEEVATDVWA